MTTLTIDGRSINVKLTYLHVVPVAENLSGGPPSVAARLGHIMTDYIWWTLAVHFESQANIKGCIFLQMKEQRNGWGQGIWQFKKKSKKFGNL